MDLSEVLDVTEPVECTYMGKTILAHVFTAGHKRLTKEDREVLGKYSDGDKSQGEVIDMARAALPIMLKGIDFDGSPLTYKSVPFPDNVSLLPDEMLVELGNAVLPKWNAANPTSGGTEQNGSQPPEIPELNQTATSIS